MTITREAGEKGWWESTRGIGEQQALYANLEAGAVRIREYQQTFIPGLLQTPEFASAQAATTPELEPLEGTADGMPAASSSPVRRHASARPTARKEARRSQLCRSPAIPSL
jgi:Domain of unknown function (DUF5753)